MNKVVSFTIALLLSIGALYAQNTVKGTVVDTHGKGIQFVNVVAMQLPDSTFVTGCITDAQGGFLFENLPAECYLTFSSIGYQKQSCKAEPEIHIVLDEAQIALSEVSVVARRLTERPGGYTMRMQNNPLMNGKKVLQALDLLPNIHVENSKVNILNRVVEAIYIDGLRIRDEAELDALPIEQIDRIEVSYTSALREGAGKTGGVLYVYLKKQNKVGWVAKQGVDVEYMPHYGWRRGNANNYFSARWEKLTIRNSMIINKTLYLADEELSSLDKISNIEQRSSHILRNWSPSFYNRLSASYELAPNHFLASSLLYNYTLGRPEHTTKNLLTGAETYLQQQEVTHRWQWVGTYKWTLSEATSLNLSADLLNRRSKQTTEEQRPKLYDAKMDQNTRMLRVKPELTHRLKNEGTLTFGGDLQWVKQDEVTSGLEPTAMRTSSSGAYSILTGEAGKLQYEVGLRLQNHTTETTQAGNVYRHKYTGLFPSLSAMYLLSAKHSHLLNLQVERLMEPIPYSAISAYRQYEGAYEYSVGNPDLRTPVGTQMIALLSLWGELNLSFLAIHYQSPIYFDRKVDEQQPQTTYTIAMNGEYQLFKIASVEWQHQLTDWWNIKTTAMLRLHSANAGIKVKNQAAPLFRHNSTFTFNRSFGAGLRFSYEPTMHLLDRTMESVGSITGNVYKSFLRKRMDVRLDFVLYRKGRRTITENSRLMYSNANLTHTPSLTLSLSYRFGGGKKVKPLSDTKELQEYHQTVDTNKRNTPRQTA